MNQIKEADYYEIWKNPFGDKISFIMWDSNDKLNRLTFEMAVAELRQILEENY